MAESSRQAAPELTFRRNMPVEKQWKAIDRAQSLLQGQRNIQLAARDEARAMKQKAGRAWANPGERLNSDQVNKEEADIPAEKKVAGRRGGGQDPAERERKLEAVRAHRLMLKEKEKLRQQQLAWQEMQIAKANSIARGDRREERRSNEDEWTERTERRPPKPKVEKAAADPPPAQEPEEPREPRTPKLWTPTGQAEEREKKEKPRREAPNESPRLLMPRAQEEAEEAGAEDAEQAEPPRPTAAEMARQQKEEARAAAAQRRTAEVERVAAMQRSREEQMAQPRIFRADPRAMEAAKAAAHWARQDLEVNAAWARAGPRPGERGPPQSQPAMPSNARVMTRRPGEPPPAEVSLKERMAALASKFDALQSRAEAGWDPWQESVSLLASLTGHDDEMCELALEECEGDVYEAADVLSELGPSEAPPLSPPHSPQLSPSQPQPPSRSPPQRPPPPPHNGAPPSRAPPPHHYQNGGPPPHQPSPRYQNGAPPPSQQPLPRYSQMHAAPPSRPAPPPAAPAGPLSFADKLNAIKKELELPAGMPMAGAISAANKAMGMAPQGALPAQVDSLYEVICGGS